MEDWKEGRVEEANSRTHKKSRPEGGYRSSIQDLLSGFTIALTIRSLDPTLRMCL